MAVTLVKDVRWISVDDGLVVFVPEPPQFVDLDDSGAELWGVLERSAWSANSAVEHLQTRYGLAAEEALQIVETFLTDLEVRAVINRRL